MPGTHRIQIRCGEQTRDEWTTACGVFDMTYAQLALATALYAQRHEAGFKEFVTDADALDKSFEEETDDSPRSAVDWR